MIKEIIFFYKLKNSSLFLILVLLNSLILNAQVGINTTTPTETLDVNGTVRIRQINNSILADYLLTINNEGVLKKTNTSYAPIRIEEYSVSVPSNESHTFSTENNFTESSLIIYSKNTCGRKMISSFSSFSNSFLFINGIARDKKAVPSADISDTNYSIKWDIKFPDTIGCADGGNTTQFDYSLEKNASNQYTITNKGNISRTYDFSIIRL